jgi:HSP20 family protein
MEAFQRHMDRLFEDFGGHGFGMLQDWQGAGELMPSIDHTEDAEAFTISVELPGMSEDDVELTLGDNLLTIRGEKKVEEESKDKDFYRAERRYGSFRRTIPLPGEVDVDRIDARFDKGVLTVTLPKSAAAIEKVRKIDVKAA